MSTLLRRLPLSRLLLLCGVAIALSAGATALALAVSAGPVPAPKPLAQALHDALAAPPVDGVSARIQLTDRLLEGVDLASSGGSGTGNGSGSGGAGPSTSQLMSNPLLTGASGRLWIGSNGHVRLELQSEKGDTQILYDGHTLSLYDGSTNMLYRYVPPPKASGGEAEGASGGEEKGAGGTDHRQTPTTQQIEERIQRIEQHASVSEAMPTDVAGQPAYTVRISPREGGSLIAGGELSWDAVHGVPLRAAVYSTGNSSPVIELAATEISYGPVDSGTLGFTPPQDAKVHEVKLPSHTASSDSGGGASSGSGSGGSDLGSGGGERPHVTLHGKGISAIAVVEHPVKAGSEEGSQLEGLRKVDVNGISASELPTQLGTLLSFERAGVRYLLAGSVTPSAIEALARSL